jgi:hypothetical protein
MYKKLLRGDADVADLADVAPELHRGPFVIMTLSQLSSGGVNGRTKCDAKERA